MTRHRALHRLWPLLGCLLLCACESASASGTKAFPMVFSVTTDEGEPLPAVSVRLDDEEVGVTNARGSLRSVVHGFPGELREVHVSCPKDYAAPDKAPTVHLRQVMDASGTIAASEVRLTCTPKTRAVALVVRTPGLANVPVMVYGREIARTDKEGTAHALVKSEPKKDLRVVLDTSAYPRVLPANPHMDVRVGTTDDVVVFNPELTTLTPRTVSSKKKPKPKVAQVLAPERIR